jgi:hypothetical protein
MNTKSPIARAVLVSTAAVMTLACVSPALAQSPDAAPPAPPSAQQSAPPPGGPAYDANGHYYYDGCQRDEANRATTGGVVGLAAGAVAGSNIAGRHDRTGGAVIGGLLGALVGSSIGRSTAACAPNVEYAPRPYPVRHYRYYGGYYGGPVYAAPPPPPPPPPPPGYYDNGPGPGAANDGCQNVESRVQMPDGRTQTRLVKTCPDSNGHYQIVD